ncbi:toxin-antitoxin system HicB family antitoxin [Geothermobacter hydrogeniphilus]|uniref:Toxin-antitoxin system HicB family antitoxin n=1 Tax=Geothermobacter hydrogeniphilus TaxID=1969733 RepID=A0A2K2HC41_9BACT|nr:type II toxin-antitoxin system HicB family antitoxin [Geothermobacter hydrogeniphilus]PNU20866.1 toxin-antitoxin system HicB family antitoxin [Geothermobacter hydrogeniphilus]
MKKTVEEYMELPYTVELTPDDGSYFVKIKELDGCMSVGDSPADALAMIEDAKREWFAVAIEDGLEIPLPESMRDIKQSGKFALRMPKSLHQKLAESAEDEGVSLNQYIVTLLAENHVLASFKRLVVGPGVQTAQSDIVDDVLGWAVTDREKSRKVLPYERRKLRVVGE